MFVCGVQDYCIYYKNYFCTQIMYLYPTVDYSDISSHISLVANTDHAARHLHLQHLSAPPPSFLPGPIPNKLFHM